MSWPSPRLATSLCGIPLSSPVIAASGTFAYGVEFASHLDLNALGGFVVKGLSAQPIAGNPPPRIWESESGMINSIGLQNIGVRAFVKEKLPALRGLRAAVFANVFGYAPEDYLEVLRVLEDAEGLAGYEMNVSCPNTKHGGMFFSSDPALLATLIASARALNLKRPLIVKLSPNVASIAPLAKAAEDAGADAISLVNTFVSLAVDARARRTRIGAPLMAAAMRSASSAASIASNSATAPSSSMASRYVGTPPGCPPNNGTALSLTARARMSR